MEYDLFQATEILDTFYITDSYQMLARWLRDGRVKGNRTANRKDGWKIAENDLYEFIESVRPGLIDIFNKANGNLSNQYSTSSKLFFDQYGIPLIEKSTSKRNINKDGEDEKSKELKENQSEKFQDEKLEENEGEKSEKLEDEKSVENQNDYRKFTNLLYDFNSNITRMENEFREKFDRIEKQLQFAGTNKSEQQSEEEQLTMDEQPNKDKEPKVDKKVENRKLISLEYSKFEEIFEKCKEEFIEGNMDEKEKKGLYHDYFNDAGNLHDHLYSSDPEKIICPHSDGNSKKYEGRFNTIFRWAFKRKFKDRLKLKDKDNIMDHDQDEDKDAT